MCARACVSNPADEECIPFTDSRSRLIRHARESAGQIPRSERRQYVLSGPCITPAHSRAERLPHLARGARALCRRPRRIGCHAPGAPCAIRLMANATTAGVKDHARSAPQWANCLAARVRGSPGQSASRPAPRGHHAPAAYHAGPAVYQAKCGRPASLDTHSHSHCVSAVFAHGRECT